MAAQVINPVTLHSLINLGVSSPGLHAAVSALLFGTGVWGSHTAGVIANRALSRQQFAHLQTSIFPVYFWHQSVLTAILLLNWIYAHPELLFGADSPLLKFSQPASFNFWMLSTALAACVINQKTYGPLCSVLMKKRSKMERAESCSAKSEQASDELKAVAKSFRNAHTISALVNLLFLLTTLTHIAFVGAHGF